MDCGEGAEILDGKFGRPLFVERDGVISRGVVARGWLIFRTAAARSGLIYGTMRGGVG